MTNVEEMAKAGSEAFGQFATDPTSYSDLYRKSTQTVEALTLTMLKAAESTAEVTGKWTMDTLGQMRSSFAAGSDGIDYANAAKDFASASAESAAQYFAAYTDIAKQAQIESAEIVLGSAK